MCAAANGLCTLRAAIQEANRTAAGDVINLTVHGTYTLTLAGRDEDAGATGDLDVTAPLTIVGAGPQQTIIDGAGVDRVFDLFAATTISGVTVRNGDPGPGIAGGGAMYVGAAVNLTDAAVTGNHADHGGGIQVDAGGMLTLTKVTVSGNTATIAGGGIEVLAGGTAHLTNGTLSGNAGAFSGGISNEGRLTLTNVTVSGNTLRFLSDATLRNTIVANTTCSGAQNVTSAGNNLESANTCGLMDSSDLTNTGDPKLGPLQDNGGPTRTHALLSGSPAIDAGSADCPPPATDQRGVVRPDGTGGPGGACDIGAYEATTPLACGDVNGDGTIDITDALLVAQYGVKLRTCGQAPFSQPQLCDVTMDGLCNITDALRIAQCGVRLVSCAFICGPFSCP